MEINNSLLTTWKYFDYQLHILFKANFWFSSKESALNFGEKLERLEYRLRDNIYPDPKKVFYMGIPPSREEFEAEFPRLTLFTKRGKELQIYLGQTHLELSLFDVVKKSQMSLKEFFKNLQQDISFEKQSINVLDEESKQAYKNYLRSVNREIKSSLGFDLSISLLDNRYLIKIGENNQEFWNKNLKSLGGYFDVDKSGWLIPCKKSTTEKIRLLLYLVDTNVLFNNDIILISEELKEMLKK